MRWDAEPPLLEQLGLGMTVLPQNSGVVPQKPCLEQQTLSGQLVLWTYCAPQPPGSHSALASHELMQLPGPQYSGEIVRLGLSVFLSTLQQ